MAGFLEAGPNALDGCLGRRSVAFRTNQIRLLVRWIPVIVLLAEVAA